MRKIVFDIETVNTFQDVGSNDPVDLDISLLAVHDSETNDYYSFTVEELPTLWPIMEKADLLIGFNLDHFDVPLLNKYYHGDLTKIKSVDIMKELQKVLGRRISLQAVAEATLGKGKSGHGLDAITWWRNGEIEKVRKYCIDDVKVTKDVYEYALKNAKLKYKDKYTGELEEVPLDTSHWEEIKDSGITHSLPF